MPSTPQIRLESLMVRVWMGYDSGNAFLRLPLLVKGFSKRIIKRFPMVP
jgi:hypothetical protein